MSNKRAPLPYFTTDRTQELWKVLQFDNRLIAFYRPLVDVLHSVKATVYLSQMIFWTRTGRDIEQNEGWFHKTSEQFARETGLSKYEQETARKNLKQMGLIQTKMQGLPGFPMPAMPWYRVNLEGLSSALSQALKISASPLTLADLRTNTVNLTTYLSKPIIYHTGLAKVAEGVNAGLMLTCFVYSYRNGYNQNRFKGFVSRNIKVWQKETGLTYEEQITARRSLMSKGLIVERHLTASRNIFTEINFAKCCDLLLKLNTKAETKPSQKSDEKRASQYAEKGVSSYGESPNTAMAKPEIKTQVNPEYSFGNTQNKGMAKPEIIKEQITEVQEYGFSEYSFKPQPPEAAPSSIDHEEMKPAVVVVDDEIQINPWVWPKCFVDEQDKHIAIQKLNRHPKVAQQLLDEITGNERAGKAISKPLRYLDKLIGHVQNGTFIAELAHKVKASREQQAKQQKSLELQPFISGHDPIKQQERKERLERVGFKI
jgi:hypothetical protein